MNPDLNIRQLIMGYATQLRYVKRFGTARGARMESVAEHSYYCALYSLMIYTWWIRNGAPALGRSGEPITTLGDVLARAILHDLEKCRTGDFPRPFKYSSSKLREMLDAAARVAISQVAEQWTTNKELIRWTIEKWSTAKADTIPGRIVSFADALSCLSYVVQEALNHNDLVLEDVPGFQEYMDQFKRPEYDFIRSLANQATEVADRVLAGERDRARL